MNMLAIVAVIGALVVGGFAGSVLTDDKPNHENRGVMEQVSAQHVQDVSKPESIDFVSTRPEVTALPVESLSTAERESLVFMREEEKLARDVYDTLYEKWGLNIFSNIAQSEQTHTEAVRDLLVKYNIADPVTDDTVGVFTNTDLQALYDTLVAQGFESELEALKVGALIEDMDIYDLQKSQSEIDNADIALVYGNLERGSRNHLRAFMSQIESRGGTYEAQYITQEQFDEIKNSETERGGGSNMQGSGRGNEGGKGGGAGRGWGGR